MVIRKDKPALVILNCRILIVVHPFNYTKPLNNMLITCPDCGKSVSSDAASCPNCGCPENKIRANMSGQEILKNLRFAPLSSAKCPVCSSSALQRIGAVEGVLMAGFGGASKRHKCISCGHLF